MRLINRKYERTGRYNDPHRKEHWSVHDLQVGELCNLPTFQKASEEEDLEGKIDLWFAGYPFNIKITGKGLPMTYNGNSSSKGYELFKWNLEHQDLVQFNNINRMIIIIYINKSQFSKEDAKKIAEYINEIPLSHYYFDIDFTLKGKRQQESHPLYGKKHRMDIGLLIHYEKGKCTTYPKPERIKLSSFSY